VERKKTGRGGEERARSFVLSSSGGKRTREEEEKLSCLSFLLGREGGRDKRKRRGGNGSITFLCLAVWNRGRGGDKEERRKEGRYGLPSVRVCVSRKKERN